MPSRVIPNESRQLRGLLVVDTCVLIDILRGYQPAQTWLREMATRYDITLSHSVITTAELVAGAKTEKSLTAARDVLSQMRSIPIDEEMACRAGDYLREWRLRNGLRIADAVIAATAAEMNATLITRDATRFPMNDLAVYAPY